MGPKEAQTCIAISRDKGTTGRKGRLVRMRREAGAEDTDEKPELNMLLSWQLITLRKHRLKLPHLLRRSQGAAGENA